MFDNQNLFLKFINLTKKEPINICVLGIRGEMGETSARTLLTLKAMGHPGIGKLYFVAGRSPFSSKQAMEQLKPFYTDITNTKQIVDFEIYPKPGDSKEGSDDTWRHFLPELRPGKDMLFCHTQDTMREPVQEAAKAKLHVFAEKPFHIEPKEAWKVVEEGYKNGMTMIEGMHKRGCSHVDAMLMDARKGNMGEVYRCRYHMVETYEIFKRFAAGYHDREGGSDPGHYVLAHGWDIFGQIATLTNGKWPVPTRVSGWMKKGGLSELPDAIHWVQTNVETDQGSLFTSDTGVGRSDTGPCACYQGMDLDCKLGFFECRFDNHNLMRANNKDGSAWRRANYINYQNSSLSSNGMMLGGYGSGMIEYALLQALVVNGIPTINEKRKYLLDLEKSHAPTAGSGIQAIAINHCARISAFKHQCGWVDIKRAEVPMVAYEALK